MLLRYQQRNWYSMKIKSPSNCCLNAAACPQELSNSRKRHLQENKIYVIRCRYHNGLLPLHYSQIRQRSWRVVVSAREWGASRAYMKCCARAVEIESTLHEHTRIKYSIRDMVSVEMTYHDSSKAQHAAVEEEKADLLTCGKPFALVHVNLKTTGYAIWEQSISIFSFGLS